MRIACFQIQPRQSDPRERFVGDVVRRIRDARGADLIVLPELWATGYFEFERYEDTAERLDGPTVCTFREVAADLGAHVHVGSIIERCEDGTLANTSVVVGPDGEIQGAYRKIHLFGHGSRETELLRPGRAIETVDIGDMRLGLAICYDLRFPELFRGLVNRGAEVFVVVATWPRARRKHWETLIRARAIENLAGVIACNAAGFSASTPLAGSSAVVNGWGELSAVAVDDDEDVLTAELDLATIRDARRRLPSLNDRVFRDDLDESVAWDTRSR